MLPLACAVGYSVDMPNARFICGLTYRLGVRRADGSLDRTGFLGATADMISCSARLQGLTGLRTAPRSTHSGVRQTTLLMRVADAGTVHDVRASIAAGAALDAVDCNGETALHWAAAKNRLRIVAHLLDGARAGEGADIDAQDHRGRSPLMTACSWGCNEVVRLLLSRGANALLHDRNRRSALHCALNNVDRVTLNALRTSILGALGRRLAV